MTTTRVVSDAPLGTGPEGAGTDDSFIREFTANQRPLYAYIMAQASGWDAAEEIFQRVSLALWTKRGSYDRQRPFMAWAVSFARLEVQKYLSEQGRRMMTLSEEALQALDSSLERTGSSVAEKVGALERCVEKLPPRQQTLLQRCYAGDAPLHQVASAQGMTANSLYLQLKRIRDLLWKCVTARLAADGGHE